VRYPHQHVPANPLLRLVWWIGQTGEYFHEPCGEPHVPGVCRDGVDRNDRAYARLLVIVDYPPFVALFRLAGAAIVAYVIWRVVT
jgi:hypothetical protein